jgi:hypothetical protein
MLRREACLESPVEICSLGGCERVNLQIGENPSLALLKHLPVWPSNVSHSNLDSQSLRPRSVSPGMASDWRQRRQPRGRP